VIKVFNPLLMGSLWGVIDMLAVEGGERLALTRVAHIQSLSFLVGLVVRKVHKFVTT
jgi:hypothetical protein